MLSNFPTHLACHLPLRSVSPVDLTSIVRYLGVIYRLSRFFYRRAVDDAAWDDALNKVTTNPADLLIHLNALRKHLVRAVLISHGRYSLFICILPTDPCNL